MKSLTKPLAVIDNNVFLSAYLWGGTPRKAIKLWQKGKCNIGYSPSTLVELVELFAKFKFTPDKIIKVRGEIEKHSKKFIPRQKVRLCRDPKDNQFLELSFAAKADYLVTGDKDLLSLKNFRSTQIVTPKQFLVKIGR